MDGPTGRYSRDELVRRSGADATFVDRLLELGVLTPAADGTFGPGEVQQVRLVEACDRAGMSAEAIAEACRALLA